MSGLTPEREAEIRRDDWSDPTGWWQVAVDDLCAEIDRLRGEVERLTKRCEQLDAYVTEEFVEWAQANAGESDAIAERDEARAEVAFLMRFIGYDKELSGLSAQEMVLNALGDPGAPRYLPRDAGDVGRMRQAYEAAPKHLQPLMAAALRQHEEGK